MIDDVHTVGGLDPQLRRVWVCTKCWKLCRRHLGLTTTMCTLKEARDLAAGVDATYSVTAELALSLDAADGV